MRRKRLNSLILKSFLFVSTVHQLAVCKNYICPTFGSCYWLTVWVDFWSFVCTTWCRGGSWWSPRCPWSRPWPPTSGSSPPDSTGASESPEFFTGSLFHCLTLFFALVVIAGCWLQPAVAASTDFPDLELHSFAFFRFFVCAIAEKA